MNTRSTLVTAALLTAAVPASGQTTGPVAGPANGAVEGAASVPDFSGPGPAYPSPASSRRSQVPAR